MHAHHTLLVPRRQRVDAENGARRDGALDVAGPVQGVEYCDVAATIVEMHLLREERATC